MNHTTNPNRALRPLLLAALSSLGASSAFAQAASAAAADQPIKLEAFVSTGTRFSNRTVTESPVPIDVITRNDITTGGYTGTAQVLQTLVPSFNFPRPSLTDGTDHIRPATLRSLAPDQTLVLINGRRGATYAHSDDGERDNGDERLNKPVPRHRGFPRPRRGSASPTRCAIQVKAIFLCSGDKCHSSC